jgi:hypothetical protein
MLHVCGGESVNWNATKTPGPQGGCEKWNGITVPLSVASSCSLIWVKPLLDQKPWITMGLCTLL